MQRKCQSVLITKFDTSWKSIYSYYSSIISGQQGDYILLVSFSYISNFENIKKLIQYGEKDKAVKLIVDFLNPKIESPRQIAITGHSVDVSEILEGYHEPTEIVNGRNLLVTNKIQLKKYFGISFFLNLYEDLFPKRIQIKVNTSPEKFFVNEKEVLELLRLCFWINVCDSNIKTENYRKKIKQFASDLEFSKRLYLQSKFIEMGIRLDFNR
jgi:hypothetical protein